MTLVERRHPLSEQLSGNLTVNSKELLDVGGSTKHVGDTSASKFIQEHEDFLLIRISHYASTFANI
jgi:hypothetical protein